jgi:hypothetical protein
MFRIKQNDTSPALSVILRNAKKQPVNLIGSTVRFHMKSESGKLIVNGLAELTDDENGVVTYFWKQGDTNTEGVCLGEFQVTYEDGNIETFPNNSYIKIGIVAELA